MLLDMKSVKKHMEIILEEHRHSLEPIEHLFSAEIVTPDDS